ncbi:peptidoglycan-associated lipoprotein Pal [Noviherbaspirillum sedimenti]|uniref:Peptidoglycan-associated lipoprotein n=1 Tax=Noviherbaspirillum sedimenti TaxID=2320865 RepID=A0A3A3FZV4_9BURK|nr:peptidoglycan-associated lipoprotein Pal [Noviherbaspirillum sedimenti]RJG01738.1 peptidoglycan-associated lipoprotein Pal [Noviherbaspirillum sedimenti]
MQKLSASAFILCSALALSACSSTSLNDKAPIEDRAATPAQGTDGSRTVATVDTQSTDPLKDAKGALAQRSFYFDLDSYVLKAEAQPVVEAHAKYLSANKGRKVVIQGNTDERGGREYNLALGQKRAEAVRKSLSLLGVADAQMEAVSFGKEKPKAQGSDEASWSENRRADLAYQ